MVYVILGREELWQHIDVVYERKRGTRVIQSHDSRVQGTDCDRLYCGQD